MFTLKNKKVSFIKKENEYFLNDKKIKINFCLLAEASLTKEFAYLIVVADKVYNLKSTSWLKKQTDKENDLELVNELNSSISDLCNPVVLKSPITGIMPSKVEENEFYHYQNYLFCPQINFDYNLSNVEVVFFERLSSYTRTFDLTLVQEDLKRVQITGIQRKKYLKEVKDIFRMGFQMVETGPDPVEWAEAIEAYKNGTDWDNVYVFETEDDESDEWQPGETEDETEDETENETEDEYIPTMSEEKKRKLDNEWESKSKVLDCDDYDIWQKKQKVK